MRLIQKPTISKYQRGDKVGYNKVLSPYVTYIPKPRVEINKSITNQNGTNLKINNNLLSELDTYLIDKNIELPQRQAILYTVVQEGNTTGSHNNGAYGLLGWRGSRIPQGNQMDYLYDTIFGAFDSNHWNDGGNDSGYKTGKEAQQAFINADNVNDALKALNYGYVRPDENTRKFRSKTNYFQKGGKTREEVIQLQTDLVNKGYLIGENEIDGIIGPKTTAAYNKYLQDTSPKPKIRLMSFEDIKTYEQNINNQDNETIINYYHKLNNTNQPYIVDDKVNNKLRVYINGELIKEYNAIHGKNSSSEGKTYKKKVKNNNSEYIIKEGDYLGKIAKENNTTVEDLMSINNIINPDFIKIGQKIKLPGFSYIDTEVDPDEATVTYTDSNGKLINLGGNLTTPAGIYFSSRAKKLYHGVPSFIRRTSDQVKANQYEGIPSSIHARTIIEGANTNGCTGLDPKDMVDLDRLLSGYDNVPTYILPANQKNKFKIRNGKLTFKSHDINKTPSYNEMDYSSIQNIKFKSDNLNNNQKNIIKRFSQSLIKNKERLQKDLGLNNDTYLQLSKYCLGILGVESNYGDQHSGLGNFFRATTKLINKNSSSPDYKSKYYTYGAKGDFNSVGLTQIRTGYLGEQERKLFKKYNISKDDLVNNPEKAALATMIKLASEYKNQGYNYDKAISSWNNRGNYLNRVINASNRFNIFQNYSTLKNGGTIK